MKTLSAFLATLFSLTPLLLFSATITFNPDSVPDQTFTVGTSVNLTLPTATGGTPPYTYTLDPIPAGLSFDPATQLLSGTPTMPTTHYLDTYTYTYTTTDVTGASASLTFRIYVLAATIKNILEHNDRVETVSFSPDGTTIASGSIDGTVRLWDVATGTLKNTLVGDGNWVYNVSFSPDGTTIASAGTGFSVYLWDVATGTLKNTLPGARGSVVCVAFSPDGTTIASGGGADGTVRLWDVATGTLKNTLIGHTNFVWSVAFSPDGTTLASGSRDGTVRLWDVATNTLKNTLVGNGNRVYNVAFSPDGTTIASASRTFVRLWDVATGTLKGTFHGSNSVAFSPDGTTLVSGSNNNNVYLSNVATATLINALTGHNGSVYCVAFSPDGTTIASGDEIGLTSATVILWQLVSTPVTFTPDSVADQTFTVGTPVDLMLPAAIGGTPPYTYTLSALPIGLAFDAITRQINGTPTTPGTTETTYTATDATGASASLTFTITVEMNLDINADGQVNVIDLMWVAMFYGTRGDGLAADVNADGVVNVEDFAAVAAGVDAANPITQWAKQALFAALKQAIEIEDVAAAPMNGGKHQHALSLRLTSDNVAAALSDVRVLAGSDMRLGKWLPLLEELLHLLTEMRAIPETTALLPNYPNPFNPETWLPYQLATSSGVTLSIHSVDGRLVRTLDLGHQPAGVYQSRHRAAYWDGRNNAGEPVGSGVYFYTLTAGEFTATRKMLILK